MSGLPILATRNRLGLLLALVLAPALSPVQASALPRGSWLAEELAAGQLLVTGDGGFLVAGNSSSDAVLVRKVDGNAAPEWETEISSSAALTLVELRQAMDDGVFVAVKEAPDGPLQLARLDAAGALVWTGSWGGGDAEGSLGTLTALPDGGCLLGGHRPGPLDLDCGLFFNVPWLLELDANGSVVRSSSFVIRKGGTVERLDSGVNGAAWLGLSVQDAQVAGGSPCYGVFSEVWLALLGTDGSLSWLQRTAEGHIARVDHEEVSLLANLRVSRDGERCVMTGTTRRSSLPGFGRQSWLRSWVSSVGMDGETGWRRQQHWSWPADEWPPDGLPVRRDAAITDDGRVVVAGTLFELLTSTGSLAGSFEIDTTLAPHASGGLALLAGPDPIAGSWVASVDLSAVRLEGDCIASAEREELLSDGPTPGAGTPPPELEPVDSEVLPVSLVVTPTCFGAGCAWTCRSEGACDNGIDDDEDGLEDCEDPDCDGVVPCLPVDGDEDGDGVPNGEDVCMDVADPDQIDSDSDGVGDACDNCGEIPNAGQVNEDGDSLGDACDNCPTRHGAEQPDPDDDAQGDACDNCPSVPNPSQADDDADGLGNACDNCPLFANGDQDDFDGDSIGDACDNCVEFPNADQADADGDGWGDACIGTCAEPAALDLDSSAEPLRVAKRAADELVLTWPAPPGESAHVYEGSLPASGSLATRVEALDHQRIACAVGDGLAPLSMAAGSAYYLVQAVCADGLTPLGRDSFGLPRALGRQDCP